MRAAVEWVVTKGDRMRIRVRTRLLAALAAAAAATLAAAAGGTAAATPPHTIVYDSFSAPGGYTLSNYAAKWSNIYGLGDMAAGPDTRSFADGTFFIDDAPFRTTLDFSVFDHLKYIGVSTQSFPVPALGSVEFSSTISAQTPGTVPGRVVHGSYGPPGSYPAGAPYAATVLQGQQAGAVMNMINFATGQLFDWFVSGNTAFTLIERLTSSVTGNTADPSSPAWVGPDKMYTQIIKEIPVAAGVPHEVSIRYTRTGSGSSVQYFLDSRLISRVDDVGIPLDRQHVPYTGTYPSLGPGEPLRDKIDSFVIGHGTFTLLDAFPFQWGWNFDPVTGWACDPAWQTTCDAGVSIPASERLFGQGVRAHFDNFAVTTRGGSS
jgi:uncharacterized protein DUF6081